MRRLAVIAVHGVADQQPGHSARQVAELLLRLPAAHPIERPGEPESPARYDEAEEAGLVLPVRKVRLRHPLAEKRTRWLLDQRSAAQKALEEERRRPGDKAGAEAARGWRPPQWPPPGIKYDRPAKALEAPGEAPDEAAEEGPEGDRWLDHEEMREQLHRYEPQGAESTYRTVRLAVHRRTNPAADRIDVHELFWADLSRLGDSVLGVFFDFYQLLFFLCGLGTATLNRAVAHFDSSLWRTLRLVHQLAEVVVVLVIPLLNLTLLTLVSVLVATALPPDLPRIVLAFVPVGLAAGLLGYLCYRWRRELPASSWPLWILVPLLGGAALLALHRVFDFLDERTFAYLLWLIAAGLVVMLLVSWNRTRPGALWVGSVILAVTAVCYAWQLWISPPAESTAGPTFEAAVAASSWIFGGSEPSKPNIGALGCTWTLFFLLASLASLLGLLAQRRVPKGQRRKARAAVWTAALTLTLPGLLVLIINIALWQALVLGASKLSWNEELLVRPENRDRFAAMVDFGTLPWMLVVVVGTIVAVLAVAWAILPAVRSEFGTVTRKLGEVRWLGNSLRSGFFWIRLPGELIRLFVVVVLPAIIAWQFIHFLRHEEQLRSTELDQLAVLTIGLLLFVAVTGSRGPFRFLALGFRAALDIALDVANWLRLDPPKGTPRARISARYASLLRHVCRWRDPQSGKPYTGLVIVAHSQGSVITADLLRFLVREAADDPDLSRLLDDKHPEHLPVYLFTMGCPLRQLYGRRFPFRYGWARNQDPSQGWEELPEPLSTGARHWANAYRSGDYVGRYLWHDPREDEAWDGSHYRSTKGRRTDFCIGSGGHIHYWDSSAPEIGRHLDRLIAEALGA